MLALDNHPIIKVLSKDIFRYKSTSECPDENGQDFNNICLSLKKSDFASNVKWNIFYKDITL